MKLDRCLALDAIDGLRGGLSSILCCNIDFFRGDRLVHLTLCSSRAMKLYRHASLVLDASESDVSIVGDEITPLR